ncbi:MAG: four helix bundle protein [Lysobacterales bacterium]
MGVKQSYRDLVVWQRAIDLTPAVYVAIRTFPNYETYALTDQIRRAVVSIPANIAEGQGRQHRKEFLQHLNIAKGSLAELHTLLIVAQKLEYLSPNQLLLLEEQLSEVARPLNGLIGHLGRGTRPSPTTDNRQPTTAEADS